MPMYLYRCEAGHTFEARGKMDGSDAPTECLHLISEKTLVLDNVPEAGPILVRHRCLKPVQKQIAAPARSFPGADSWRK